MYNRIIKYSINEKIDFNARLSNSILPIRPHASGQVYKLNWDNTIQH